MREYLDKRKFYLARILASEAPPFEMVCSGCGPSGEWRCLDCLGRPLFYQDCCRHAHQNNPFHKIQKWEKEYFKDSTLLQAGLTLHFGHGGKPCPSIPSDDFHQDEGEDEQMFGLPAHLSVYFIQYIWSRYWWLLSICNGPADVGPLSAVGHVTRVGSS